MHREKHFDVGIIGGGIAGLSLAIQLQRKGHQVILFEKEKYPFHRVCGEYISGEAIPLMTELGINVNVYPKISKLEISSPRGQLLKNPLESGGIGISRYSLDAQLAELARKAGVRVLEQTKVQDIGFQRHQHTIQTNNDHNYATVVAGSFGKLSNLDRQWNRHRSSSDNNQYGYYIGVKYHLRIDHPKDTISLHNFSGGYCGLSAVEDDQYCLCYLINAAKLTEFGNAIPRLEQQVLRQNPFLNQIFATAEFVNKKPYAISRIHFNPKTRIDRHVLMLGDAAGMITPICGNGMSMAFQASRMAANLMDDMLTGKIDRAAMEGQYKQLWDAQFSRRLRTGRFLQRLLGKPFLTDLSILALKPFPSLVSAIVQLTHGQPF